MQRLAIKTAQCYFREPLRRRRFSACRLKAFEALAGRQKAFTAADGSRRPRHAIPSRHDAVD